MYAGYGNLPALMVSCFWTNHVDSRVGMITPYFERQMQLLFFLFSPILFYGSFDKTCINATLVAHLREAVENATLVAHLREAVEPLNAEGYQHTCGTFKKEP